VSLLRIEDVHVRYGKVEAIFGVTMAARQGCITTVIGPNGAGKTTLLSSVAGLHPVSGGRLLFDGQDVSASATEERLEMGLVLVPEKRELFPDMSVEDNLELGAYHRRWRGRRIRAEDKDEVFALFPKLKDRRRQVAETLSGGERQMLALGRALMSKPRLLLLDEPSLGLAPLITQQIFRIVSMLRDRGASIILVEQNARGALSIADYGYVLEQGRVALEGAAAELANDPGVISSYLGAKNSFAGNASKPFARSHTDRASGTGVDPIRTPLDEF
jgi:branched-chain amino acid transport system ATP-binding protein